MTRTNPYGSYHEGELAVQTRAGVGSDGLAAGRAPRGYIKISFVRRTIGCCISCRSFLT